MQINNFKRLQEEEELSYKDRQEERVKMSLSQSLNAFRLVGQVLDMYLPKIFNLFVLAAGGKVPPYHPTSTPPSQVIEKGLKDRKPSMPDDEQFSR